MKKQQFLKVDKSHAPKNKLQKVVQKHLEALEQTLFSNIQVANQTVFNAFEAALDEYKGVAARPTLSVFDPEPGVRKYQVEDVIYITIYEVKNRS